MNMIFDIPFHYIGCLQKGEDTSPIDNFLSRLPNCGGTWSFPQYPNLVKTYQTENDVDRTHCYCVRSRFDLNLEDFIQLESEINEIIQYSENSFSYIITYKESDQISFLTWINAEEYLITNNITEVPHKQSFALEQALKLRFKKISHKGFVTTVEERIAGVSSNSPTVGFWYEKSDKEIIEEYSDFFHKDEELTLPLIELFCLETDLPYYSNAQLNELFWLNRKSKSTDIEEINQDYSLLLDVGEKNGWLHPLQVQEYVLNYPQ